MYGTQTREDLHPSENMLYQGHKARHPIWEVETGSRRALALDSRWFRARQLRYVTELSFDVYSTFY